MANYHLLVLDDNDKVSIHIMSNNQEYGIQLLEQSFDPQFVNPTIYLSFPQGV